MQKKLQTILFARNERKSKRDLFNGIQHIIFYFK